MLNYVLTVDPGINTGWCLWMDGKPYKTGVFRSVRTSEIEMKLFDLTAKFFKIIQPFTFSYTVYIEGVDYREGSLKSKVSASRQNLILLAYIVGAYVAMCRSKNLLFKIVKASEWKGQLSDKAVDLRIQRLTGEKYKQHISSAVGIGYGLMGVL